MLFGASYYHEYQPYERLDRDLDLMVGAGFTVIRVGESTWASYEPRDGEIGFDALSTVVDAAVDRGLKVIVGTPTYAIPPWLARAHPEVMAHTATGVPIPFGARQNVDFTHPAFRFRAERLVRAMGAEFGGRAGVIGFQVDNEIGVHHLHNTHVVERFRRRVAAALGGVEGINDKWGLTYWSHRLSEIGDLWVPDGNTNPGYALEWDRFQAELTVEFLVWQRDLLRQYVAADQFVTHDVVGGHGVRATHARAVATAMDRTAVNIYFPMQRALELPEPPANELVGLAPWWLVDAGTWTATWRADMAWSAGGPRGSRFLVTEAQAGSIGEHATAVAPYPGQLRLVAHLFAARGADLLAYWHWHTLHYGAETYWGGVLGHDLEPNRTYAEVSEIGAELRRLEPELRDLVPDADVAVLHSWDSHRALQFAPALCKPGTAEPDSESYHRIAGRLHEAASDTNTQVRVVHSDSDWAGPTVLLVPALYIADDAMLERITAHAAAGAHVVATFRTGYADAWARVRWTRQPGVLRDAAGMSYQEFTTLNRDVPLRGRPVAGLPTLTVSAGAVATGWADGIEAEAADVLCGYDDPFLSRFAAITTHPVGRGRFTWIGTLLDRTTTSAILRWALAERSQVAVSDVWRAPANVRITSATRPDGRRLWFVANHRFEPCRIEVPAGVRDLTGEAGPDGVLELGAWDSRILLGDGRIDQPARRATT